MEQERKLRIISLDESGEFERFLSDDIRFIGGLIIDKPLPENAKTDKANDRISFSYNKRG